MQDILRNGIARNRIVIRYNEIFLKGQNRAFFEKKLVHNIKECLKKHGLKYERVNRFRGRIIVHTPDNIMDKCECLKMVFGISSYSAAIELKAEDKQDIEGIKQRSLEILQEKNISKEKSFRIVTKRCDKRFPINSQELNEIIGSYVQRSTNATVKLQNPDLYVGIEIINKSAYLSTEKIRGSGGLPTGTEGKVICLLSGGIDSPVAAWLMMKRGCKVVLLYVDNTPFVDELHTERVRKIAKKLSEYYYGDALKLYVVKNGTGICEFKKISNRYTCIFCKRMMMRFASEIAKKEGAEAIADGSSIAQVASQTISNLSVISNASKLLILRPLIGLDKEEIIGIAKRIGTFDISITKTSECMAVPKHPATQSRIEKIELMESKINIERLVHNAIRNLEMTNVNQNS